MERGTLRAYNRANQKIAVAVDGDKCAVFELTSDYDLEVGQRLRGNLDSQLCFALENLATGEMLGVIPQGVHLSFDEAKREIGL